MLKINLSGYPVLIFITAICFFASIFGVLKFDFYNNLLALLLLNGSGLALKFGNLGISWYISSLFWSLSFYYYILKYFEKTKVDCFMFCTVIFCYSFLIHSNNGLINGGNLRVYGYVFNIAMMRGLAGIGLGYFVGEWYRNNIEKIRTISVSIWGKLFLTALEFVCLYFIINNLMLHKLKYNNHIIFIIAFAAIIILFLLRKGYISKILEIDFWGYLSRYTYSIYMTHLILFNILKGSLWKYHPQLVYAHPILNIVCTLVIVLIFGIFTYHCVEKPCMNYFKNKGKTPLAVERGEYS